MSFLVVSSVGTTGDILPYVALSRALVKRGHRVRVCTHPAHEALFEGIDVDLRGTAYDASHRELAEVFAAAGTALDPLSQFKILAERIFLKEAEARFGAQRDATRGADLVVAHFFDYLGQQAALDLDIPLVTATYMPETLPSEEAPPFPLEDHGTLFNKLAWMGATQRAETLNALVRELLGRVRSADAIARHGLVKLGIAGAASTDLHLLEASRHLVPVRHDWPPHVRITGKWFDLRPTPPLDAPLAEFLERNPRPIVITFGSMGGAEAEHTKEVLSNVLAWLDLPAIVQRGYANLETSTAQVFVADYVPHDALFPHAACVVHHAGSGTTAAVARSGVPSVPVPHLFDQYYWAGMLHRKRVATKPIPRGSLTAPNLGAAIRRALRSNGLRARAQKLAAKVRAEPGVLGAVELIEARLEKHPR
ncbi:MAG: glycosyltransferase family 1 protein [Deltaproteobacteria bacterium]|nr:glycosyltransferase family 1 protein [Deltaproteobacteria bacterium]